MLTQSFVRASIENNEDHQPSRESVEWAYITAPVHGHSDDSADETYAPSTRLGQDDEGEDADTEVEPRSTVWDLDLDEDEDMEEDMEDSDSVLPSVERHGDTGPSRVSAPNWWTRNNNHRVQKRSATLALRPPWVWRETPIKNPYLKKIAEEEARWAAPPRSVGKRTRAGPGRFGLRMIK